MIIQKCCGVHAEHSLAPSSSGWPLADRSSTLIVLGGKEQRSAWIQLTLCEILQEQPEPIGEESGKKA